jgi:PAS domain S-box-containing protein
MEPTRQSSEPVPTTGQANILIVDDRPENLLALTAILEPLGERIVSARSGTEALRCLLNDQFAVLLLDVHMPGISGYELAGMVRQRQRTRHVPIIFLTAAEMDAEHIFRGYQTGAVDYLIKPFDPDILRSKVSVFVELFNKQREIERQAEQLRRQELQQLAHESEARYRFLAEASPNHVWEADSDGTCTFVSQRMERDLSLQGALSELASLPLHPDDTAAFADTWRKAKRHGTPLHTEARLEGHDRSWRWYLINALPFREQDGTITRWVGTNTDIDERKRDELRRAQLLEAEQRARAAAEQGEREAKILAELVVTLEEPGSYRDRLARLGPLCVPDIADFAVVELHRPDGRAEVLAVTHRDPAMEDELHRVRRDHAYDLNDGTPNAVVEVTEFGARQQDAASWGRIQPNSLLTVRMRTHDGHTSRLLLGITDPTRRHRDHDRRFAGELARRVALMLDNARLRDSQARVFRDLQLGLLAGIHEVGSAATTAVRYQAANRDMEIGGDWYDVFNLDEHTVGIVIGDVVGQGLAAATTMAKLRSAVRALAGLRKGPAEVLSDLDRYVEISPDAAVTTLTYSELDARTHQLVYASAGHPPPLVLQSDRSTRWLDGGRSTPLGVPNSHRIQAVTTIEPGATLILYTDGLIERRGEVLDAGLARLVTAATNIPAGIGLQRFADRLIDDALDGAHHDDDIAVLCLRVEPADTVVFTRRFPGRPEQLRPLRAALQAWLEDNGVDRSDTNDLILACSEALSNSVEHAYESMGEGRVTIEVRLTDDDIAVAIRDFGHWRTPTSALDHGRGFRIMRALTDSLHIDQRADGTTVWFHKTRSSSAQHEACDA